MPGRRREEKASRIAGFYSFALLVAVLDQIIKFIALESLSPGQSIPVIPRFFHFTLVYNTGIAFGFFNQHPGFLFALISISILVLAAVGVNAAKTDRISLISFALILGGAIGNWLDRLRHHAVIDYLDFRVWPVFNLADTAITIGVILFIGSRFFARKEETPA